MCSWSGLQPRWKSFSLAGRFEHDLSQRLLVHKSEMCIQPQDVAVCDQFVVALNIVAPAGRAASDCMRLVARTFQQL